MIELWVVAFALILARVGTFLAVLPLLGGQNVPRMVKLGLAVALSCQWFMAFGTVPGQELTERLAQPQWLSFGLALGREAFLGGVLGFAFGLFLVPMRIAGEFISQEMGLSLGAMVDPTSSQPASAITQMFEMLGSLIFLGMDGHHVFLAVLHGTFVTWPVGGDAPGTPVSSLVSGAASAEEWGVLLALPVVICLFVTSVLLALMARAVPTMNIFTVGFALRIGAGLVAAVVLMPQMLAAAVSIFGHLTEAILHLV